MTSSTIFAQPEGWAETLNLCLTATVAQVQFWVHDGSLEGAVAFKTGGRTVSARINGDGVMTHCWVTDPDNPALASGKYWGLRPEYDDWYGTDAIQERLNKVLETGPSATTTVDLSVPL